MRGQLKSIDLRWRDEPAIAVVMAANGYPGHHECGSLIEGLDAAAAVEGVQIFHAETKSDGLHVLANVGRVLNVCALSKSMCQARSRAYEAIARIHWPDGFCRRDIGWRAVEKDCR
jgi:phosphoribosylamine---glycine ligase